MFELLKKKKNYQTAGMLLNLIKLGEEYAREQQNKIDVLLPERSKNFEQSYKLLQTLGLEKTMNFKMLADEKEERDMLLEKKRTAESFLKFVKGMRDRFPSTTFLISESQFLEVLKKYDLSCGLLKNYRGVVPEKNIEELAKVSEVLKGLNESLTAINSMALKSYNNNIHTKIFYVTGIDDHTSNGKGLKLKKYLERNPLGQFLPLDSSRYPGWAASISFNDIARTELPENLQNIGNVKLYGEKVLSSHFLIACPEKYLDQTKVKFEPIPEPVDPIVFQYCPYGILIHSVWGEEAEDQVLKEYAELNNIFAKF